MRYVWILVAAGCADRYDRILALEGDPVQGEVLYINACVSCHGSEGEGGGGGGPLVGVIENFTGHELLEAIDDGPDNMPAYRGEYSKQEMADLYKFMTLNFE